MALGDHGAALGERALGAPDLHRDSAAGRRVLVVLNRCGCLLQAMPCDEGRDLLGVVALVDGEHGEPAGPPVAEADLLDGLERLGGRRTPDGEERDHEHVATSLLRGQLGSVGERERQAWHRFPRPGGRRDRRAGGNREQGREAQEERARSTPTTPRAFLRTRIRPGRLRWPVRRPGAERPSRRPSRGRHEARPSPAPRRRPAPSCGARARGRRP